MALLPNFCQNVGCGCSQVGPPGPPGDPAFANYWLYNKAILLEPVTNPWFEQAATFTLPECDTRKIVWAHATPRKATAELNAIEAHVDIGQARITTQGWASSDQRSWAFFVQVPDFPIFLDAYIYVADFTKLQSNCGELSSDVISS